MLNIFKGKAGSGKTVALTKEIIEHRTDDNLIIVNPQSIEYYEHLCAEKHISADVVSIYDVFGYIANGVGINNKVLSLGEKNILISQIISSGHYSYIPAEYSFSGVIDKVTMAISDMKKQHISADQFKLWTEEMRFTGNFFRKSAELAAIWEKYEEECTASGFIDTDSLSWSVIDKLNASKTPVADYIYIDTLQEYTLPIVEFIKAVSSKCKECYAAFRTTDGGTADSVAFSDATTAIRTLSSAVSDGRIVKVNAIGQKPVKNNIEAIARNFFSYTPEEVTPDGSVELLELPSPVDEVKKVCSEIIKLRQNGETYENIAVAAPSMESYYPVVKQVFDDNDIPFHFFKTNRLAGTQLYSYLIGYVDFDAKSTECYVNIVNAGVSDASDDERVAINTLLERFGSDVDVALQNCSEFLPETYVVVNPLVSHIRASATELKNGFSECRTFGDYAESIYDFLTKDHTIEQKLGKDASNLETAYEYHTRNNVVLSWNAMMEVLDAFVKVAKDKDVSFELFKGIFKKTCEDKKVVNNIKFFDEVTVTSLSEVVDTRKNVLFAIGCTDSDLTMVPERSFYQEEEKREIEKAFDVTLPSIDYYIGKKIATVYSALTSPYEKLVISFPETDTAYSPASKASVLRNVYAMFKNNIKEIKNSDDTADINFESFLCELSNRLHTVGTLNEVCEEKFLEYMIDPLYSSRLTNFLKRYNTDMDRYNISEKFEAPDQIGVTTAQKYNECPFKAYTDMFLHPKSVKMFEESSANIGTFYHNVFYNLYTDMTEAGKSPDQLVDDKDLFDKFFNEAVSKSITGHNENILDSTEKNKFLKKRMIETAYMSVYYSLVQVVAGEYTPKFFEYKINGSVIDRVDVTEDGYARVIDYKSSDTKIEPALIEAGVRIQLPMYMSYLDEYKFGGVYYFRVHKAKKKEDQDENDVLKDYRLSGLTNENAAGKADKALATEATNSNVVSIRTTNDGNFYKNSAVISEEDFRKMQETAVNKYNEACEGMKANNSVASPYHSLTYNSCTYCPYSSLCHKAIATTNKF